MKDNGKQKTTTTKPDDASPPVAWAPPPTVVALATRSPDGVQSAADARSEALARTTVAADGFVDIDEAAATEHGETVTGGFDGPQWLPQLDAAVTPLNTKALAEKLAKMECEVITRQSLTGRLQQKYAWGRKLYFLDTIRGGKMLSIKLPEHIPLYEGLGKIRVGAMVLVKFAGFGKAKDGNNPPCLYIVTAVERGAALSFMRKDALWVESKDAREARFAKLRAQRESGGGGGGDDVVNGDDGDVF